MIDIRYCYDCIKFDRRKKHPNNCKEEETFARSCQKSCHISRKYSAGLGDIIGFERTKEKE